MTVTTVINVWTSTRTVDALKSKSQAAKKLSGSTQSLEVVSNIKHGGKQQIQAGYEGRYIPASEVKAEQQQQQQQSHLVGRHLCYVHNGDLSFGMLASALSLSECSTPCLCCTAFDPKN